MQLILSKYNHLTLEQHAEVVHRVESGESQRKVAEALNVGRGTMDRIMKQESIISLASEDRNVASPMAY